MNLIHFGCLAFSVVLGSSNIVDSGEKFTVMRFSWQWNGFAAFAGVMAALLFSDVAVRAAPTPAPAMSFLLTPETLPVVSDNFDEPLAVIPKTPTPGNGTVIFLNAR